MNTAATLGTVYVETLRLTPSTLIHTAHATEDCAGISEAATVTATPVAEHDADLWCSEGCIETPTRIFVKIDAEAKVNFTPGIKAAPAPEPPAAEMTDAEIIEMITNLGRKFEKADMTGSLRRFAKEWLDSYEGDFSFLLSVKASTKHMLSDGQAKGVLNCYRADVMRNQRQAKQAATPSRSEPTETSLDLSELPAGRYAIPGGDSRLKVKIDKPTKGNWAGFVFVRDAAEYGSGQRYGIQRPGSDYRGDIEAQLRTILADPQAAMAEYGHLTSTCGVCGRTLEDADSIARGIGPVCARKF